MAHMQLREALKRLLLRRQRRERREARLQGLAGRAEPRLYRSEYNDSARFFLGGRSRKTFQKPF